jgi:gliding motility-associated lipoprotein GldK
MNKIRIKTLCLLLAIVPMLVMQGCGLFGKKGGKNIDDGQLRGAADRPGWKQVIPYGMILVPPGTFHMGQADEDVPYTQINQNRQISIGGFYMDDTEITNNEYRQFIDIYLRDSAATLGEGYIMTELYPDTLVWENDFVHHYGDPLTEYYYAHPAFDEYPVVGIDWEAAQIFCRWRTTYWNNYRRGQGEFDMPSFRLPSEAEWEYASRGGRDMAKYPWGSPYLANTLGCLLANFKPGRGNYYNDGFMYTAPVASYFPNDFGLYDMAGNVAEWCNDAFSESSVPRVMDINPTYIDQDEFRKVVRGGSWKDIAYYLETGTRTYEYKDSVRSYIGFRCAMTYLGRSSGREFGYNTPNTNKSFASALNTQEVITAKVKTSAANEGKIKN